MHNQGREWEIECCLAPAERRHLIGTKLRRSTRSPERQGRTTLQNHPAHLNAQLQNEPGSARRTHAVVRLHMMGHSDLRPKPGHANPKTTNLSAPSGTRIPSHPPDYCIDQFQPVVGQFDTSGEYCSRQMALGVRNVDYCKLTLVAGQMCLRSVPLSAIWLDGTKFALQ
jgi:hypothetical protein